MKPFNVIYKSQSGQELDFTQYAKSIGEAFQNFMLSRPGVEVLMVCTARK